MRLFPRIRLLALLVALPMATVRGEPVAAPSFLQALAPADRQAVGIGRLTAEQTATLDALIQRDIRFAREGDVVAFAKTFSERRAPEERRRAGLDQMSAPERARLDQLVARAVADRPMAAYVPAGIRPHLSDAIAETKPLPEVHGQVSLFVGGNSHGGSFYGGSFDAVVIDPSKKFMVGVGMSEIRGRGLPPCSDEPIW